MALISGKETKPEISVRSFLFRLGFRFRKNVKELAGKPDIVLPKHKTVIFVHGCFWHGHDCNRAVLPTSNIEFWKTKIQNNMERDKLAKSKLEIIGWRVLTIWGCEIKNKKQFEGAMEKIINALNSK